MYKNKKTEEEEEEEEEKCVYINTDPSIDLKASRPPKNVYKRCQHVYQVSIQENQGDKKKYTQYTNSHRILAFFNYMHVLSCRLHILETNRNILQEQKR